MNEQDKNTLLEALLSSLVLTGPGEYRQHLHWEQEELVWGCQFELRFEERLNREWWIPSRLRLENHTRSVLWGHLPQTVKSPTLPSKWTFGIFVLTPKPGSTAVEGEQWPQYRFMYFEGYQFSGTPTIHVIDTGRTQSYRRMWASGVPKLRDIVHRQIARFVEEVADIERLQNRAALYGHEARHPMIASDYFSQVDDGLPNIFAAREPVDGDGADYTMSTEMLRSMMEAGGGT